MDTTAQLESRIDNALARIKGQIGAAAALEERFETLQAAREKDLSELDDLVAELKPLVEED